MEFKGRKILQKVQVYESLAQRAILGIDTIDFLFQEDIKQKKFERADLKQSN